MQVCIDFVEGWFLRINTRDIIRPCVSIKQVDNQFLKHDSHIDCSLHIVDEYELEEALLRGSGVIGRVDLSYAPTVLEALLAATFISPRDKQRLRSLFEPYI